MSVQDDCTRSFYASNAFGGLVLEVLTAGATFLALVTWCPSRISKLLGFVLKDG
jgi:hypothetical protein